MVTALGLVAAGIFVFKGFGGPMERSVNVLLLALCLLGALVSFVSDLIFRKSIPSIKKLWIVEGAFIVFTLVLILVIKIVLF